MLQTILLAPVLIALVLFALSNRHPVTIGFWPTDLDLVVPLCGAVLVPMAAAFLLGALVVWPGELSARRRARRAETRAEMLEDEIRALRARAAPPGLPPPEA